MRYILLSIFIFLTVIASAQTTIVRGTVTDGRTNQPLPYVSLAFEDVGTGTTTDAQGKYILKTTKLSTQIKVSFIGYKSIIHVIVPGRDQVANLKLYEEDKTLGEVAVKSGKKVRYRNKDNPAVELIRKVIEHKPMNRVQSYDYAEYQQYEKLQFSLTDLSPTISQKRIFRNYKFLFDNRDTTLVPGKSLLPVYLDEKLTQNYYRKDPKKLKSNVLGAKKVNFGSFIDDDGINTYLNRMYSDVDIYSNNIFLMTNMFLSPIADAAPTFYKFFITDTITDENNRKLI